MNYVPNRIDDYFRKIGLSVRYNCLNDQDILIHSYIKETYSLFQQVDAEYSNHIKYSHYDSWYNIKHREKRTGFEKLKSLDQEFRYSHYHENVIADMWDYPDYPYEIFKNDNESYLDNLKKSISNIDNPMIFYSGGVDSELLLTSFLDLNIDFKVVIFELIDKNGQLINDYDIDRATEFCKSNGIIPIVKQICPETLWVTKEFSDLSKKVNNTSPQIITHVYMIHMMADEYPGYTYCFAGEVRYQKNPFEDAAEKFVLVKSNKVNPGLGTEYYGYNVFQLVAPVGLWVTPSTGKFNIAGTASSPIYMTPANAPTTGNYTNTPARAYDFRVVTPLTGGMTITSNNQPQAGWQTGAYGVCNFTYLSNWTQHTTLTGTSNPIYNKDMVIYQECYPSMNGNGRRLWTWTIRTGNNNASGVSISTSTNFKTSQDNTGNVTG